MPVATPPIITTPFAEDGIRDTIPVADSGTPGRASYEQGFPPITMQPVAAGGIAPFGQDFNGILFAVSSHAAYAQGGQLYQYSSDVATAIGGYAKGSILGSADGSGVWINQTAANSTNPDAGGAGWLPLYSYGHAAITGLTGGVVNVTAAQAAKGVIVLSGTLVANLQLVFPNTLQSWLIINGCTSGGFSVTVKTSAGTGVVIPPGGYASPIGVYGDTINLYPTVSPLVLPLSVVAAPDTIPLRDASSDIFARRYNSSGASESFTLGNIVAESDVGDGYLRKITLANFLLQIFANAALTGVPTAPAAAVGAASTQVANLNYVRANTVGGVGQSYQNVRASRAIGTTYTNTTGRPIMVNIAGEMGGGAVLGATVNGVDVGYASNNVSTGWISISFVVPAGATYRVAGSALNLLWAELR